MILAILSSHIAAMILASLIADAVMLNMIPALFDDVSGFLEYRYRCFYDGPNCFYNDPDIL